MVLPLVCCAAAVSVCDGLPLQIAVVGFPCSFFLYVEVFLSVSILFWICVVVVGSSISCMLCCCLNLLGCCLFVLLFKF